MSDGIGIRRVWAILNKITSEENEKVVIEELKKKGIKVIGTVYFDARISEAGLRGKALPGSSRAEEDIKKIVQSLFAGSG